MVKLFEEVEKFRYHGAMTGKKNHGEMENKGRKESFWHDESGSYKKED